MYSCGEYVENKIELDETQETAIQNFLTQECITKNTALFNQLTTSTADWANADLDENFFYEFSVTNKEAKQIAILKRTTEVMYIYVESADPEIADTVYKYTTQNNADHMESIKSLACGANNSFSGDASEFQYLPKSSTPNGTDPERTTFSSNYTVRGNRPVFFSLFSRQYTKTIYEADAVKTTDSVSVSFKITDQDFDFENESVRATYKTLFTNSKHCIFNASPAAAWLGANYPDTFSATVTCGTGTFNWDTDIIAP